MTDKEKVLMILKNADAEMIKDFLIGAIQNVAFDTDIKSVSDAEGNIDYFVNIPLLIAKSVLNKS